MGRDGSNWAVDIPVLYIVAIIVLYPRASCLAQGYDRIAKYLVTNLTKIFLLLLFLLDPL